ncbi:hypothetical protein Tsubulata_013776 [Turnera subulata]|uniref:Caffeoyl-CoA O-methyltransferase n=1 Tax=Turnera subulata TaxID=218843 RepID=A0A9Q0J5A6_9ROSI|nr:hypothetical protein Tsubulata_013776 [Turnera subulata]
MENAPTGMVPQAVVLQSGELLEYILETTVYPGESPFLKELRNITSTHPFYFMGGSPHASQLMALLLKLTNAKKTIEIGVFTGYTLLLTAQSIPEDGKITAIDIDRKAYDVGLPIIQKAGVEHKINFIESPAIPVLDKLLEDRANEGSYDFAFVDADKGNYLNYHERLMKLVKVGGLIVYDNTLWGGTVALPEEDVPQYKKPGRLAMIEFNKRIAADTLVVQSLVPMGDGNTVCIRLR